MSEEKSFHGIVYDEVNDADPPLYNVIYDALSSHLDVELLINIVASYTITMRRIYLSCAMKPDSSVSSTEAKQDEAHLDDQAGNRNQAVLDEWARPIYRRLCMLAQDRTTDVKEVYFKIVHNERKRPQMKQVRKGREEMTVPGYLHVARTAVRCIVILPISSICLLVQSTILTGYCLLSTTLTSEVCTRSHCTTMTYCIASVNALTLSSRV